MEYLNEVIGREKLSRYTANIAFAGFTAPKLLWMRENEPELFGRIRKIMLPKDYINYRLTGVHCTDYSLQQLGDTGADRPPPVLRVLLAPARTGKFNRIFPDRAAAGGSGRRTSPGHRRGRSDARAGGPG